MTDSISFPGQHLSVESLREPFLSFRDQNEQEPLVLRDDLRRGGRSLPLDRHQLWGGQGGLVQQSGGLQEDWGETQQQDSLGQASGQQENIPELMSVLNQLQTLLQ